MSGLFKNILVPIDFSINSEVAVRQAVELACLNGSTIHLLHVINPKTIRNKLFGSTRTVPFSQGNNSPENVMFKLQQCRRPIEEAMLNTVVTTNVKEGAVQNQILNVARELEPDLIIIGKKSSPKLFNFFKSACPNDIAKSTRCPVLTVMRGTIDKKTKVIVIPVCAFVPKRKLDLVAEFARKYRAEIHLITMPNKIDMRDDTNSFLESYRILKASLTNPIVHHILKGNNLPRAILDYAERIQADMIFVNPYTETKISNFTGKHIDDVLTSSSKLKILAVEPYHEK